MSTTQSINKDFLSCDVTGYLDEFKVFYHWKYNPDRDQRGFLNLYTDKNRTNLVLTLWVSVTGCSVYGPYGCYSTYVSHYICDEKYKHLTQVFADTIVNLNEEVTNFQIRVNSNIEQFSQFFEFGDKCTAYHDVVIKIGHTHLPTIFNEILLLN